MTIVGIIPPKAFLVARKDKLFLSRDCIVVYQERMRLSPVYSTAQFIVDLVVRDIENIIKSIKLFVSKI